MKISDVIIEPINTEKSHGGDGKFAFRVNSEATKPMIKKAVESFYKKAKVLKVNVVSLGAKFKVVARGKSSRKRGPYKKAIVTIEGGTLNYNDYK